MFPFKEEVIKHNLLPIYEASLTEDDAHYKLIEKTDPILKGDWTVYIDLFEMKNFVVGKLIDLTQFCNHEENMMKIISLFEKVLQ